VLLPLWLQQYMGYTATWAGLAMAPIGLFAIMLTPVVGASVHRYDPRVLATISFIVFALVMWMRGHMIPQADFPSIVIPTVIQGIATAFFFIPLTSLTLSGLKPHDIPGATGLSNFVRILSGSFGTSVSTTLWSNRASLHHAELAEHITPFDAATGQALGNLRGLGLDDTQARGMLNQMIDQQAFTMAVNDIFVGAAVLFILLIALVWLARPVRGGGHVDASAAH
jgi:DHA2 family multidrug resistance protein